MPVKSMPTPSAGRPKAKKIAKRPKGSDVELNPLMGMQDNGGFSSGAKRPKRPKGK